MQWHWHVSEMPGTVREPSYIKHGLLLPGDATRFTMVPDMGATMDHEIALLVAEKKLPSAPNTRPPSQFAGRWANQMGSLMDLSVAGPDIIGTYESADSAGGGRIRGVLKGVLSGDLLSFTVLWPGGSITAWVGQLVDDDTTPRIKSLWHLVTEVSDVDEPKRLWMSVLTGSDEFHK